MRGILAFVAASVVCATLAQAQAPPAADPTLPPRYEVEVIVFAHRDFDPTEERFDQALDGFRDGAALREAPAFDTSTFAPPQGAPQTVFEPLAEVDPAAAERAEALRVRPLAPEELKLGVEYRKLRAISAYEPLAHVGWVQPGLPEADAVPIDLGTLGILNPRGTVRVHLSRFLHITLDLTYQAKESAAPLASSADGLNEIVLAPQYRLQAARSARSNELHYFDHPAFGVLVRVTPVPAEVSSGRRPAA
jgi:Peptidoglycan-binding protein, CsiV